MTDEAIDYSLLAASAVHDMKNSLGLLLSTIDQMTESGDEAATQATASSLRILRGEAARINNDLIYLLGIFRMQKDRLNVAIDEVFVADFLDDQVARHGVLFDAFTRSIEVEVDADLCWFFDPELVGGAINNALVNAVRYTDSAVVLRAEEDGGFLRIDVEDNGKGFPEAMIEQCDDVSRGIDFESGSTNLGLFFAEKMASAHTAGSGDNIRRGYIGLSNSDTGGVFSLYLP